MRSGETCFLLCRCLFFFTHPGTIAVLRRKRSAASRDPASHLRFSVQLAASANLHTAALYSTRCIVNPQSLSWWAVRERDPCVRFPLSALNLTTQQTDTLTLWGLHTPSELAGLPKTDLVVRLGQQGKRLWLLSREEHHPPSTVRTRTRAGDARKISQGLRQKLQNQDGIGACKGGRSWSCYGSRAIEVRSHDFLIKAGRKRVE